jgi:acetyl-CoA carboxylase alpha subunit
MFRSDPVVGRRLIVAGGIFALLALAYSVVIAGQVALWFAVVPPVGFRSLLWRFVRAHERIATALEPLRTASTTRSDDASTE